MTTEEFNEWFNYLSGRLPSMRTWLSRLEKDVRDSMMQLWIYDLSDIPMQHAIEGIDAIYKGTIDEPLPWDRLPMVLRYYSATKGKTQSEKLFEEMEHERKNRYLISPDEPSAREIYDELCEKLKNTE